MKSRIARYILMGAGTLALAGTPALFAGDLRHDYNQVRRENADIRQDQHRYREDLEHGRYYRAARERADLNRDYRERNAQIRDIRRDERWRY
jgi:hypothetical protein